ncbi:hypothetical protein K491DRAFT_755356 [Lophiostoma macrostomum CBS 122681]|uniref:Carbohydrate-binding module family 18 protein n=1 Tax=Lophiostoma macrostomum CBS 122681 TaxID=1314788 RepID=A0A6A6TIU4_9PLEO|nr:hypothetical protein K491DRAFT_755356 [Lophiostoma macrostomum CBS 122681]
MYLAFSLPPLLVLTPWFFSTSDAVCCTNSGAWWCITGATCTPNCDDGHSYCDPSIETCLNDNWGGCVGIVTITSAFNEWTNLIESTSYTDTVTSYDPIVTNVISVTSESDDTITTTSTDEQQTQTATTTIPGSTVTVTGEAEAAIQLKLLHLHKRADTSTTTLYTTYTTDCAVTEDPSCTTWVEGASTLYLPSTMDVTSTILNDVTGVVTMIATAMTTITETITGDDVTVTAQGASPSTDSGSSETSETSAASETESQATTTTATDKSEESSSTSSQTGSGASATSSTSSVVAGTAGAEPRATLGAVPMLMGILLVL